MLSLNTLNHTRKFVQKTLLSKQYYFFAFSTTANTTTNNKEKTKAIEKISTNNNTTTIKNTSSPELRRNQKRDIYADQDFTWVDQHLPQSIKPYAKLARIDRPIGTMLLLWPCWWSIGLATPSGNLPDLKLALLFGVGAFVMRGAGCTINDLWDRQYDAKVERTLNRPLASGQITPFQALIFLGGQLSCGLGVLLQLNTYSIMLGAASLGLVIIYPLMKRYTYFPQLILGLTFNWGAFLGWAALHGNCDWNVLLPLYASGVMWTLMYDTLYAHQDKKDDSKLGLKSTALYFGDSKTALYSFAGMSTAALAASGYLHGSMGSLFYMGIGCAGSHMFWQVYTADFDSRLNLNERFVSNNHVGGIVMCSIMMGSYFS